MTIYITPDNTLHDDADGRALHLLPKDARIATEVEIDAILNPQVSLDQLKFAKNLEINLARLAANQKTFTHGGKLFACDPLSRSDIDGINGHVGTRGSLPVDWIGGWKAIDNSIVPIQNVADWNAFYDSMIAQGQANFLKSQNLKAQLAAATTSEQIEAIVW